MVKKIKKDVFLSLEKIFFFVEQKTIESARVKPSVVSHNK